MKPIIVTTVYTIFCVIAWVGTFPVITPYFLGHPILGVLVLYFGVPCVAIFCGAKLYWWLDRRDRS